MSVSSSVDQRDHFPLPALDEHVEALPEAQFAHDIVCQIAEPVRQVPYHRSFLAAIRCHLTVIMLLASHDGAELADMQEHEILHALEGLVRERLTQHTPLPAVDGLVDNIVGVVDPFDGREGVVEVGFLQSLPMSVDVVQPLNRVDGDEVGSHTDMRAILLVERMQPEVTVAFQPVIELHPGGHGSEEWTAYMAEGVEEPVVKTISEGLCMSAIRCI